MKNNIQKLAEERISYLFKKAEEVAKSGNPELAKRYVTIAKNIGMKSQLPIPRTLKRKFCKKCYSFFVQGKTVRVRIQKKDKRIVYTCLICGNAQRYPFSKERKALKSTQRLRKQ